MKKCSTARPRGANSDRSDTHLEFRLNLSALLQNRSRGPLAQLVEHWTFNPLAKVIGQPLSDPLDPRHINDARPSGSFLSECPMAVWWPFWWPFSRVRPSKPPHQDGLGAYFPVWGIAGTSFPLTWGSSKALLIPCCSARSCKNLALAACSCGWRSG